MQRFALFLCASILAVGSASAQQEYSKYSLDVGGGYTVPAGATGNYSDWGWNVKGGFVFNYSAHMGAAINVGYDSMGLSSPTVAALGIPGGHVDVLHATLDPVYHLTPHSRADFYLTAGGGFYRVYREFGANGAAPTDAYIPSLGFNAPGNGPVPIPFNYSVNKPGFDVGGGVTIGAIGHGKVFAEARWEHVFLNAGRLDLLPVTFGFRW